MNYENPFTLTFGQRPNEFIPRGEQISKILDTFDMESPSNQVFMIAGVRGSGKTVSPSVIADHYTDRSDWFVLRLSADNDLIAGAVSELNRTSFLQKNNIQLENDALLRNLLEKIKRENKRVLFIIDEIVNNEYVKIFASNFQIYITQHYPFYLIMAGLYDNISNLQNEKSLTFLYRAPKIFLAPLSIPSMTTSYRTVFDIAPKEAVQMAN